MKHYIRICYVLSVLFILSALDSIAYSYNLRQFSSKNGLSNSAILSMCQDDRGYMWFGSCDGLNVFNGVNFHIYKPTNSRNNLSGNLIESVLDAEGDILWVQTNYGLDRFDSRKRTVQTFKDFKGRNNLVKSKDNKIYVAKEDNYLHYYNTTEGVFKRIFVEDLLFDNIIEMAIDDMNTLWIFSSDGNHKSFDISFVDEELHLTLKNYFIHNRPVLKCFFDDGKFYFVDQDYDLYEYDTNNKTKFFIYNIHKEVAKRGEISAIIRQKNELLIGFKSSGLIRLQEIPELKNRFFIQELDIKSGIFCLKKDKFQDIVWIGTDGQGVYMYYKGSYTIKTALFRDFDSLLNNPIRTLYLDKNYTLWIGTKGDGILKIHNYDVYTNKGSRIEHIQNNNSQLIDNNVYTVTPSSRNILWVGTENGINYYSYNDQSIKSIKIANEEGKPIRYVHDICESDDSTLWVSTVGEGIVKARIAGDPNNPKLTVIKRYVFNDAKYSTNYFFSSYKESDSIMWFGNRGYGAYKMNSETDKIDVFTFDETDTNQTLNDVFAITINESGYWFGTSYGLIKMDKNGNKLLFNEQNGFPNNTIHSIGQDNYDNLWLSTNQGIVKFNTSYNTFQVYKQQNELEVTEFSDGAFFKDTRTGVLFFGGVNGFVTICKNETADRLYTPPIQFSQLAILGKEYNIYDFLKYDTDYEILKLEHNQTFFSVSFAAIDYINGSDYTYLYKVKELNNSWIDNGSSNSASFTNFSPGRYTLEIKYRNNITGDESSVYPLVIQILPPWYASTMAYLLYFIIFLLMLYFVCKFSIKWYRMKRDNIVEKINQRQKEELYESKLRFFTNITHELCTPLTLIQGPCEKIISYANSDDYVSKYANLIRYNAERLNTLIQELIEFRRLETGNKKLDIKHLSVSEIAYNIAASFTDLAEAKGFVYKINIENDLFWNSDSSCLNKIFTNLISNAFKYASDHGTITVELFVTNGNLNIVISNTGKGIKTENIEKIFDRYTILDSFEDGGQKNASSRNGLGLAICNSMVKLLCGEIEVTSTLNELTVFKVLLPPLAEMEASTVNIDTFTKDISVSQFDTSPLDFENVLPEYDKEKQTIMIVDDDPSMLWFITDIFSKRYNVIPLNDPKKVMDQLSVSLPDLILSDVMMPDIDGISLAKAIKLDKLLNHIPLVLLSAKVDAEEQVRGIDSGAEVYITKPFNVEYLERVVNRLIQRKKDLKEYYGSAISAFELKDGRLTHIEDKEMYENILHEIEANISNPDLSVNMLSDALGYSTRQLYRKLKTITDKTPNELIKEYKLKVVERLLVTTNLSIDEILYKTGFSNRGNFFKVFSQEFGMTPKSYREQKRKN